MNGAIGMGADGITRENLKERVIDVLRPAKPWQPDVLLARGDRETVVVKDYRRRGFLYRFFVGLPSTWNEFRMYRRLEGLEGIPRCAGRIDRYALAIEFIEGRNASAFQPGQLPGEFFDRLRRIVDAVHARNVVICDLRNKKNVMVTPDGRPVLIDLCTAFGRGRFWNPLRTWLFGVFYQDDLLGVAKLKRHLAPDLLTPEEDRKLTEGLFLQREAMAVRDFCVRWLKKLVARP